MTYKYFFNEIKTSKNKIEKCKIFISKKCDRDKKR